ncbi:MAG: hypothetical protein NZ455_10450 [Bacteroidia bacterium]|nr:hypothetical protein [Bacteroidia bacterium]MDW8346224.1 hypothetical protein [Bacteroidia bacterium]
MSASKTPTRTRPKNHQVYEQFLDWILYKNHHLLTTTATQDLINQETKESKTNILSKKQI